jgi:hypothetical protein
MAGRQWRLRCRIGDALADTVPARVVDEDVDPPLFLDDELDGRIHGRVAQHIQCHPFDAGAEALHLGDVPRGRVDCAPPRRKLLGAREDKS